MDAQTDITEKSRTAYFGFYRKWHPDQFSDSTVVYDLPLTVELFDSQMDLLSTKKKQAEFENFSVGLMTKLVTPNIKPQTGPDGGGDGKVDAETFKVSDDIADKWLWKVKVCGIKLSSIPDYNGTWEGTICSSHNGGAMISCTLEIKQTWSEIVCRLKTDKSCSYSVAASISTEIGPNEGLVWRYVNTPRNNCKADMQMHHGVSRATINDVGELECDYYNCSRERNTCGTIKFRNKL